MPKHHPLAPTLSGAGRLAEGVSRYVLTPWMSPVHFIEPKPIHKIAVIGGDGIGPEVINAGVEVLQALAAVSKNKLRFEFEHLDWSSQRYLKTQSYMPDDALIQLKKFEAIYFGAVGDLEVPDHVSLRGLRLAICQPLQQYANVRPTAVLPGIESKVPKHKLDWVIIRENTEGEYAGQGGRSHVGSEHEVATEVAIFTRTGVRRIMEYAFQTAMARPRKSLCLVSKSNAQPHGMVMWDEVAAEVAKGFPEVRWERMLVDAVTARMISEPEWFDTLVATNLQADVLSDLAASQAGSLGIAPTANLDPTRVNPSMFEPIHGSDFNIVGKGVANPIGAFWSAAMMLEWIGERESSAHLMVAIQKVCEKGIKTPDLGGSANTNRVTKEVIEEIKALAA